MNLFDQIVEEALTNNKGLSDLRIVVEKELLHHDIFRTLSEAELLSGLTFIGGTCLRACYGSERLSEDLNFTGGADFDRKTLSNMTHILTESLANKYGLKVEIKEPIRELGNVDTWTLRVQTRPGRKEMPSQRINIDICAVPSYQVKPMVLLNPYGVDMGTSGLIVDAESREEIFADKFLAFAFRPNRIKYRDLWDIVWLHQQNVDLPFDLIPLKIDNHHKEINDFLTSLHDRCQHLNNEPKLKHEFYQEMTRFLPPELYRKTLEQENFWPFLTGLMNDYGQKINQKVK